MEEVHSLPILENKKILLKNIDLIEEEDLTAEINIPKNLITHFSFIFLGNLLNAYKSLVVVKIFMSFKRSFN